MDRKFYYHLWQHGTQAGNPRDVRILAVALHDRHIAFGETRVCELALDELERATGQHFAVGGKTVAERDAAVSRAFARLKSQGIPE